jgi:hypothetical protein
MVIVAKDGFAEKVEMARTIGLSVFFVRKTLTGQLENCLSYIPSLFAGATGQLQSI